MTNNRRILVLSLTLLVTVVAFACWPVWTQPVPVLARIDKLEPLGDVVQVTAGSSHTCVLTAEGGVLCWGANGSGQLGDDTTANKHTPVDVVGLDSGVATITAGDGHTCALTMGGGVKCWGWNYFGQLGDGTTETKSVPVNVVGLDSGVVAIAAGVRHTCALTTSGGVKCWGGNSSGQLGDGTTGFSSPPVDVVGLDSGVAAIAAGGGHTCALTTEGGVKCWGLNSFGQLGDGTETWRTTPVDVAGLDSGGAAITADGDHTCALITEGGVKCWGANDSGQLGDGTTERKFTPVDVVGLGSGVAAITAGSAYTCALTTKGGVKCWGWNYYGQLGNGTAGEQASKSTPVDVVEMNSGVAAITAGSYDSGAHTCALTTANEVKCWGNNASGQLGDSTTENRLTPVAVVQEVETPTTEIYLPAISR